VKLELERLENALGRYSKTLKHRPRASKKRNWRAASVAQAARTVWATVFWDGRPASEFSEKEWEEYREHLEEFAPRTEKNDLHGPFGEFLKAVNKALGILTSSGQPVSPKTALESLKSLRALMSRED
jgi:hypothetical protein